MCMTQYLHRATLTHFHNCHLFYTSSLVIVLMVLQQGQKFVIIHVFWRILKLSYIQYKPNPDLIKVDGKIPIDLSGT